MPERDLILQLVASLTLCDHMGDVWNAVETLLTKAETNYLHMTMRSIFSRSSPRWVLKR